MCRQTLVTEVEYYLSPGAEKKTAATWISKFCASRAAKPLLIWNGISCQYRLGSSIKYRQKIVGSGRPMGIDGNFRVIVVFWHVNVNLPVSLEKWENCYYHYFCHSFIYILINRQFKYRRTIKWIFLKLPWYIYLHIHAWIYCTVKTFKWPFVFRSFLVVTAKSSLLIVVF